MNFFIKALHSALSNSTTSIPRSFRYASPLLTNVLFSPITTRPTLYIKHAPVHMSHGDSVVYMVAPTYEDAGSRPLDSMADISAWILTCMLQVMFPWWTWDIRGASRC